MFGPFPNPKNGPLGPQKVKNDPKIESKLNVRIERNKQLLHPTPSPKIRPLGHQKVKMTPKLSQNQKSELKELYKMKDVQLYE